MVGSISANQNQGLFATFEICLTFQCDPLTKILFSKAHALCHDVNEATKSSSHFDLVMGFSTGDIIWYEPFTQKYTRINKNVSMSSL
jgi:hypothetical protein